MTTKKKQIVDIGKISPRAHCDKGHEIELVFQGEPIGVFITVTGREGSAYKARFRQFQNERLAREFRAERGEPDEQPPTVEQIDRGGAELLAACTVSWRSGDEPIILCDGERLECNEANAVRIYEAEDWIRKQVDDAVHDLGNFIRD